MPLSAGFSYTPRIENLQWLFCRTKNSIKSDNAATGILRMILAPDIPE
jgi:hypothetical protein